MGRLDAGLYAFDGVEIPLDDDQVLLFDGVSVRPAPAAEWPSPDAVVASAEEIAAPLDYKSFPMLDGSAPLECAVLPSRKASIICRPAGQVVPFSKFQEWTGLTIVAAFGEGADADTPGDREAAPPVEEWPKYQDKVDKGVVSAFRPDVACLVAHPTEPSLEMTRVDPGFVAVWDGDSLEVYEAADFEASFVPYAQPQNPGPASGVTGAPEPLELGVLRRFPWVIKMLMYAHLARRRQDIAIRAPGGSEWMDNETKDYWIVSHREDESLGHCLLVQVEPQKLFRDGVESRIDRLNREKGTLYNLRSGIALELRDIEAKVAAMTPTERAKFDPTRMNTRKAQLDKAEQDLAALDEAIEEERAAIEEWPPILRRMVPLDLIEADVPDAFCFYEANVVGEAV